jgi:hypothetical protein
MRHVAKSQSEFYALGGALGITCVGIFHDEVPVEQFVRVFVRIRGGRRGAADGCGLYLQGGWSTLNLTTEGAAPFAFFQRVRILTFSRWGRIFSPLARPKQGMSLFSGLIRSTDMIDHSFMNPLREPLLRSQQDLLK